MFNARKRFDTKKQINAQKRCVCWRREEYVTQNTADQVCDCDSKARRRVSDTSGSLPFKLLTTMSILDDHDTNPTQLPVSMSALYHPYSRHRRPRPASLVRRHHSSNVALATALAKYAITCTRSSATSSLLPHTRKQNCHRHNAAAASGCDLRLQRPVAC